MDNIIVQDFELELVDAVKLVSLVKSLDKESLMKYFGTDENGYDRFTQMAEKGVDNYSISLFYFIIRRRDTHEPIGELGFHSWNKKHGRAELFYILWSESNRRKGILSTLLPVILSFGFTELGMHRIQAMVAKWNEPSVKLLKKFGFTFEGTAREDYWWNGKHEDSDCYSLLSHEWNNFN